MKKLIFKTSLFTVPFFIIYLIAKFCYVSGQGDLFRLGYFTTNYGYEWNKIFKDELKREQRFETVSNLNFDSINNFDILIVGDSFSEQRGFAYQDYLAEYSGKKILHLDRFFHENPIETVEKLLKGDFFSKVKCKYLILESVERGITDRGHYFLNKNPEPLTIEDLKKVIYERNIAETKAKDDDGSFKLSFFSKDIIRLPMYRLFYNFNDHAFKSPTYLVETNRNLFSTPNKICLFYGDDLKFRKKLCEDVAIESTNREINRLSNQLNKKGIKLVTLICPDKYEVYYEFFKDKEKYTAPIFFDKFNKLPKNYIYIDSKKYISDLIKKEKDIYYLDDTHWSPFAARGIAKEVNQILSSQQ